MATISALIEYCGRFITRADLNLYKVGSLTWAAHHFWTHNIGCMSIFKRVSSSEDIIYFLSFQKQLIFKL